MAVSYLRNTPNTGKSYTTSLDATRALQAAGIIDAYVRVIPDWYYGYRREEVG